VAQYVAFSLKSEEQKALHYAKIDFRGFTRSLIAIAAGDQELHPNEIVVIKHLVDRI